MFAHISRLVGSLIVLAALALPPITEANSGRGMGHGGGMGNGGTGNGHRHRNGWGWWSWGVPWGWWDYPAWDGGDSMAWQQGYNTAMQQSQWAAYQRQQAAQRPVAELAARPNPKQPAAQQPVRANPPIVSTPEERAASKLRLAMLLAGDGKTADAAEFCTDIVKKYPGTPAANQAQAFLDKVYNAKAH
jgi:hypothetical protein